MTKIKVCGVKSRWDAKMCAKLGVDFIGFVFAGSPRRIKKEDARSIITELPPSVKKVGVFVNEEEDVVMDIARFCGLDILQLHGDEDPDYCLSFSEYGVFKAFRISTEEDIRAIPLYKVDAYLLDSFVSGKFGGTGESFDWDLAVKVKGFGRPLVLSGGLSAENVGEAIEKVKPEIVDVSSGVEIRSGEKDTEKLKRFVEAVRSANCEIT